MGLIHNFRGAKTKLFGITWDRVKREYAHIELQLQWWAELPRHSGLELSGTMLDEFWRPREFGEGDVVAHNAFKLMRDAIFRVLEETADTCRDHGLLPDAYVNEASYLLTGLIQSVYRDIVHLEAEARQVRQEREAQARRFTAPSQKPEERRPVHEIAQCLKQGARQFDIEDGTRKLTHFLTEQGEAFKLLASGQRSDAPAKGERVLDQRHSTPALSLGSPYMNTPKPEIVIAAVGKAIERAEDFAAELSKFDWDEGCRQAEARRQSRKRIPRPQRVASQAVDEPPTREEVLGRRKSPPREEAEKLRRDAADIIRLSRKEERERAKRLDFGKPLERAYMVAKAKADIDVELSPHEDVLSSVVPEQMSYQRILEAVGSGDMRQLADAIQELRKVKRKLEVEAERREIEHAPKEQGQASETPVPAQTTPMKGRRKKHARTTTATFTPWEDAPRRTCFVMDGNRFMFWHGGEQKDLGLGAKGYCHKLLGLFAATGILTQATVKAEICTPKVRPSEAVRNVNRELNKKISAFGLRDVPESVAFVDYDANTGAYHIKPRVLSREAAEELCGSDS